MNAPPPDSDRSARRAEYERAQEALTRLRSALRLGQQRPYREGAIEPRKLRQLKAAVVDAVTVLERLPQSSLDSLDDLAELNRQLDRPGVTYEKIHVELSDIVELMPLALNRFRQQFRLDLRETGRNVITARIPLDSPAELEDEEDAPSG